MVKSKPNEKTHYKGLNISRSIFNSYVKLLKGMKGSHLEFNWYNMVALLEHVFITLCLPFQRCVQNKSHLCWRGRWCRLGEAQEVVAVHSLWQNGDLRNHHGLG